MTQKELLKYVEATHKKSISIIKMKSADYAKPDSDTLSNFKNSTIAGVSVERGILVRMMDKISRISNLLDKEPSVVGESIIDSVDDLGNYNLILGAILDKNNKQL